MQLKSLKFYWLIWHHYNLFRYTFSGSRCTRFSESSHQCLLEVKELWKFRFLGWFSKWNTGECDRKFWNVFDQFGITIPCRVTYFLEVGARVYWWKFRFLGSFPKVDTEECDQKVWNVFDQLDITLLCSDTCFLEVGAGVSLKVAKKISFRCKKSLEI